MALREEPRGARRQAARRHLRRLARLAQQAVAQLLVETLQTLDRIMIVIGGMHPDAIRRSTSTSVGAGDGLGVGCDIDILNPLTHANDMDAGEVARVLAALFFEP